MFKRLSGLVVALMLVAGNGVVAEVVKNFALGAFCLLKIRVAVHWRVLRRMRWRRCWLKSPEARDILGHPDVVALLPNARDHVQQYVFLRDSGPDKALYARFEFEASFVNGLLTKARLPLWTANRPRVLVWMVVDLDGRRQFVSFADTPDLAAQLVTEFERRGFAGAITTF